MAAETSTETPEAPVEAPTEIHEERADPVAASPEPRAPAKKPPKGEAKAKDHRRQNGISRHGYDGRSDSHGDVEHRVETLVGQRIFALALGYEDLNDHDELSHDPISPTS